MTLQGLTHESLNRSHHCLGSLEEAHYIQSHLSPDSTLLFSGPFSTIARRKEQTKPNQPDRQKNNQATKQTTRQKKQPTNQTNRQRTNQTDRQNNNIWNWIPDPTPSNLTFNDLGHTVLPNTANSVTNLRSLWLIECFENKFKRVGRHKSQLLILKSWHLIPLSLPWGTLALTHSFKRRETEALKQWQKGQPKIRQRKAGVWLQL